MFFNLFKKKNLKETDNKIESIPLEVQLQHLNDIGIHLNEGIAEDEITREIELSLIESKPYYLFLLMALGGEFQSSEGVWGSISDDIWYFDTECIEDNGIYIEIVQNLIRISKGFFNVQNIKDCVDVENSQAWVSFEYAGKDYKWDLEVNDDWFDVGLISKINKVLKGSANSMQYAVAIIDQSCLVGLFTPEQVAKLNSLTTLKFEFV